MLQLKPVLAEKAKANQVSALKKGDEKPVRQKSDRRDDTKTELAKLAGVSHDTIHKVETVLKHGDEETKQAMRVGDISINAAHKKVKEKLPPNPKRKPKANQVAGLKKGDEKPVVATLPKRESTREELAKLAGVSDNTIAKVETVIKPVLAEKRQAASLQNLKRGDAKPELPTLATRENTRQELAKLAVSRTAPLPQSRPSYGTRTVPTMR